MVFSAGAHAGDWTRADTTRQAGFVALTSVDWLQSLYAARNPDDFTESNPVLGKHPSVGRVNNYFGFGLIAHTAIAFALPQQYRAPFQRVSIGIEALQVGQNAYTYNKKYGATVQFKILLH